MSDDSSARGLPPPSVAWAVITAVALALGGWTYLTSARVAALETTVSAQDKALEVFRADIQQQLHDLRDDVRDLRNGLLGPKGVPHAP